MNDVDTKLFKLQHSAVVLFDSFEHYQKFVNKFHKTTSDPYKLNLLIYCADLSTELLASRLPKDRYHGIEAFQLRRTEKLSSNHWLLFTPTMPLIAARWYILANSRRNQWSDRNRLFSNNSKFSRVWFVLRMGISSAIRYRLLKIGVAYEFKGYTFEMARALKDNLNYFLQYEISAQEVWWSRGSWLMILT